VRAKEQPLSRFRGSNAERLLRRATKLILVSITVSALTVTGASIAAAPSQRVSGPRSGSVRPGDSYTIEVNGFTPGQSIYLTVAPKDCQGAAGACDLRPCPICASTRISGEGGATITFRWPRRSYLALGSMTSRYFAWKPGSQAEIDVDLVATHVPRGCVRTPSLTANPDAGTIHCAQKIVRIESTSATEFRRCAGGYDTDGSPNPGGGFYRGIRERGTNCGEARTVAHGYVTQLHGVAGSLDNKRVRVGAYICSTRTTAMADDVTCSANGGRSVRFYGAP
jgi:hypothetical protein